jgi:tRNA pseudouridine38-40 synthase
MRNIRLTISYDGTDFYGWQRQPNAPTVQACLEEAIEKLIGEPAQVIGSGRTDAGVHALNQVANFRTACRIPCENLAKALNDALPPTVRVRAAEEVEANFHARYNARAKTYRYRILQAPVCSPFLWRFVYHHPFPLDRIRMGESARLVEGKHDFTSFAAATGKALGAGKDLDDAAGSGDGIPEGPSHSPGSRISRGMVRTISHSHLLWRPRASMLIYEVRGNGFLHHMVRNIVGTLNEVGRGKLAPEDMVEILKARDRTRAGPTAPARGLCLVRVEY